MTTYDRIDRILKKHGWACVDECFRYASNGRLVPFDTIMRTMPDDILEDIVAAYAEDRFEQHRRAAKAKPARRRKAVRAR